MARHWKRIYIEFLDDPRIGKLPDNLWRFFIELILISDEDKDFELPPSHQIAWRLRRKETEVRSYLQMFLNSGFISQLPEDNKYTMDIYSLAVASHKSNGRVLPSELRVQAFEKSDGLCVYCGDPAEHVDHIIPVIQGGADDIGNLVGACAYCNLSKGGRTPEEAGMSLPPEYQ